MQAELFTGTGRFWRGNLHTHSNRSDGILSPAEVCRRYQAEGYDFICLSDHFIGLFDYPITDTVPFRQDGFTTLLGAEMHSGPMRNGELWHILAVGLPTDFTPPDAPDFTAKAGQETGPDLARRCAEAGAFVSVVHPQWSGMTLEDALSIDAAHCVEIYNHGCAIGCDRPDGWHTLDLMLSAGRRLTAIATDDAHFNEPDHFGGWVMVKSEENTPDALLTALKAGMFYSSQGPELRGIELDGNNLTVRCTAVTTVIVQGQGTATQAIHGASITQAQFKLARVADSPWLRVTVIDRAERRAWSNPIWR